ncbi:MAG: pyrroline-5-carboxylate reductase family protein, partial [Paraclostridium bifermentans]
MNKKIGFIGAGNMAKAMIGGIVKSKLVEANNVFASDLNEIALENAKSEYGINTTNDSKEVVKNSDIVIVAVKPNVYDIVLEGVKELIDNEKIIVTIAAGKTIESVENVIGSDKKVIRTMPNTPALVNEGMSALCKNKNITDEELKLVKEIFSSFGKAEVVNEYLIDAVIGASGS